MKKKKLLRYFIILIFTILTTFSLVVNVDINNIIVDKKNDNIILLLVLGLFIYKLFNSYYLNCKKDNGWFRFLSLLFSIFVVLGYSYDQVSSWDLCFSKPILIFLTCVKLTGYYLLFNCGMHKFYEFITNNSKKDLSIPKKAKELFDNKPFMASVVIMLICWIPYIISFYPAILSPDPSNQIKQFFGIHTKYMDSVDLIDESVTITNHHPILHTVLLGGCTKIGMTLFDSTNIGLFLYSIIQIIILLSALAFTIKYMKKLETPYYIRFMALIIYSLVPVFPLYAMSAVKDTIFTALVIVYMINVYDLIKYRNTVKYSNKKCILLTLLLLAIMLMRNNGLYLVVLSFPLLLLIEKKNRIKLVMILVLPVVLYNRYNDVLLPYLKVTEGSIREMLSIPFQQSARYVKEYGDDLDKDEISAIDNVLGVDTLASRYKPELADPVKNEFNKYTTDEELKTYFKEWYKGLLKHPDSYIQATINNVYGYFDPNTSNWYVYFRYDKRLSQEGDTFNYSFNDLSIPRDILSSYALAFPYLPILGIIVNIGFSVWLYMYMFVILIKDKKYKYLIYLAPVVSLVLVCIASPANTYFRYAMPYIFAMPVMIAIFIDIINKKEEC
jgi:hypothetical protein